MFETFTCCIFSADLAVKRTDSSSANRRRLDSKGEELTQHQRRNRSVDIDEIEIEFDPEKVRRWSRGELSEKQMQASVTQRETTPDLDVYDHTGEPLERHIDDMNTKSDTDRVETEIAKMKPEESVVLPVDSGDLEDTLQGYSDSEDTASDLIQPPNDMHHEDIKIEDDVSTLRALKNLEPEYTEEVLVLHRLPGEKLGMGLSIESTGGDSDPIKGVYIQNINPGGAADRATGGSRGLCVGDQILSVNGTPLETVSYSETISYFREMPLRVIFLVRRQRLILDVEVDSVVDDLDVPLAINTRRRSCISTATVESIKSNIGKTTHDSFEKDNKLLCD